MPANSTQEERSKRADRMREWTRKRGAVAVKGVMIVCVRCGAHTEKQHRAHDWCAACVKPGQLERTRAKNAARGMVSIGSSLQCKHCGAAVIKSHKRQFYCPPCSQLSRLEKLPHQVDGFRQRQAQRGMRLRREAGITEFRGVVSCVKCGASFRRAGASQKICDTCRPKHVLEQARRLDAARYRRAGRILVGDLRPCKQCGKDFKKEGIHQVYCTPECKAEWWAANPQWVINRRMSAGVNGSLRDGKAGKSWQELVPYSLADLMRHLERQFLPKMTWENRSTWNIDHIVPLASFNFTTADDPQFRRAWALTNLRPLWATENIRKSAKRTHLL